MTEWKTSEYVIFLEYLVQKPKYTRFFFMSCFIFPLLHVEIFISNCRKNAFTLYIREMFGRHQHTQRNHSHLVVEGITTFTISADTCPVKITTMRKRLFYADCHFLLLSLCDIYKKASALKVFQISSLHYIQTLMPNFWKCLDLKMLNSICKLWTSRFEWFHCSMLKPAKYLMEKVYAIW